jgi:hypothetical protein
MAKSKFEKLSEKWKSGEGFGNSLIIFVIAALIVSVLGWASIAELDNVTRGDGKNCIHHPEPNGPVIRVWRDLIALC